jgi:4-hydroxy-tetrahydrodipicolinate reductase
MKLAILGYGKMGKEIEQVALQRNHTVELIIDIDNKNELNDENLQKVDVAVDFSIPSSAYDNIVTCFNAGTPIVSGTTGWLDKFDSIKNLCNDLNGSFFYASNYGLGLNIFRQVNIKLAQMMNHFSQYNVEMEEVHHTQKLDAPSGTAITLANDIIGQLERKKAWELNQESNNDKIRITAVREGQVPGIHRIKYDSEVDFIEITHSAKSRKGLALGAVLAAEYIKDKKGVFSMDDLLNL